MRKKEYILSIIIPIFNCEKKIKKCVKSIIDLEYSDKYQIILVNDGSADKSLEICKQLAYENENVFYLNQRNQGVSYARNEGIKFASGKWCTFVDADDFVEKEYIKNIFKIIDECDRNSNNLAIFGFNKIENGKCTKVQYAEGKIKKNEFLKMLCEQKINAPWNKIFKIEVIKQNDIEFPLKIRTSEDGIFLARYVQKIKGDICSSNKILYNYVKCKEGAVANPKGSYISDLFEYYRILKQIDYDFRCNSMVNDAFIGSLYFLVNNLLKNDKKIEVKQHLDNNKELFQDIKKLNIKNKIKYILLKYKLFEIIRLTI